MKTSKAVYLDDNVSVPGVLVKRFLRRPVFIASDPGCGWDTQIINKENASNVIELYGKPAEGHSYFYQSQNN